VSAPGRSAPGGAMAGSPLSGLWIRNSSLRPQARQRASQLSLLARNLELTAAKVAPEELEASLRLRTDVVRAEGQAAEARTVIEGEGFIPGTAGELWQQMWIAANEFVVADHEHHFPDSSEEAICPLCQQSLDANARERFTRFAAFMSGEAQTLLTTARGLRNADLDALIALPLDSMITQDLVDLVGTYDARISGSLLPALAEATRIRDQLVGDGVDDTDPFDAASLASTFVDIIQALREFADRETASAATLSATDTSAVAAAQLEAQIESLNVRKGLASDINAIGAQHDRSLRAARLAASKSACTTTGASRKNSELSSSYVSKVCQRFEQEAKQLGLDRVPVELTFDGSARGVSLIKVCLKDAPQVPVSSVLSEGEQRVTAIAGFFADLTESGDLSTLVFDDPVSSLDQEYRVKVAQRLLQEAESRQVLVFTHDFSFVQYLYEEKRMLDKQAVADGRTPDPGIHYLHIDRAPTGAGVVTSAEEWRHVSVGERIGRIKQRIQSAGVLYRNNDHVGYGAAARDIVGAIRETWEAFVEQELLNQVVTRHDRRVQTTRLSKLTDLTDADIATVELGMSIDSRFMTGHASPVSDGSAPMSPDELSAEVRRLEDCRKAVLGRRNR